MKLSDIISEVQFNTYEGMVQVIYDENTNSTEIAALMRALPGVTTVTLASDEGKNRETLKIKLITQKDGMTAFQALKQNAITKYPPIKVINIGQNTIEKK
jgi:hypothetical protein